MEIAIFIATFTVDRAICSVTFAVEIVIYIATFAVEIAIYIVTYVGCIAIRKEKIVVKISICIAKFFQLHSGLYSNICCGNCDFYSNGFYSDVSPVAKEL